MRAAGIRRRGGLVRAAAVLMSAGIVLGVLGMAGQEDSAGREHGAGREYRAGWEGTAKLGDGGPGEILGRAFRAGGTWIAESLWNQQGYFFMEKAGREADRRGWERWKDPDPSYRNYQAVQRFYEEHAYLAWYGGDETGSDTEENGALAQDFRGTTGNGGQGGAAGAAGQSVAGQSGSFAASQTLAGSLNRPISGRTYVLEQLMDYDFLMKNFYNVHTSTTADRELMDAKALLDVDLSLDAGAGEPQILIYHTHSQEAFADSGPGETVVAVGEELARLLTERGYSVYHDTSVYDLRDGKLDRSKAYNYALEGVAGILQKYPSIQVVLDVHRDGVGEDVHLMTEVDGRPTAQIMFFNGLSQTPEGAIEYLPNPYRRENLAFSLQMQLGAAAYFPGYTRKIYLKGLRYNMHLRPRSSLIEVGAQTNTFAEAVNAMEPLAELLDMVLRGGQGS